MFLKFIKFFSSLAKKSSFELVPVDSAPRRGDKLFAAIPIRKSMTDKLPRNYLLACLPQGRGGILNEIRSLNKKVEKLISENQDFKIENQNFKIENQNFKIENRNLNEKIGILNERITSLEASHYDLLLSSTSIGLAQYFIELEKSLIETNLPVVQDLIQDKRLRLNIFHEARKKKSSGRIKSDEMANFLDIEAVQELISLIDSKKFQNFINFRNSHAHPFGVSLSDLKKSLMTLSEKSDFLTESNKAGLSLCQTYFSELEKLIEKIDKEIDKKGKGE